MRTQGLVLVGTAVFMAVIAAIYWFTSYEPTGSILLAVTIGLGVIPGAFLLRASRRSGDLPEDRDDADPDDAAGDIGWFAASSVWPVVLAGGAAMFGIGLVFGVWAGIPGALLIVSAFVGGTLESRSQHE